MRPSSWYLRLQRTKPGSSVSGAKPRTFRTDIGARCFPSTSIPKAPMKNDAVGLSRYRDRPQKPNAHCLSPRTDLRPSLTEGEDPSREGLANGVCQFGCGDGPIEPGWNPV